MATMSAPTPQLSDAYGLVVRFTVKEGSEDEFDRLVEATVAEIGRHEPGTLLYAVHAVEGQPRVRIFYELYADHDAFLAHEEQPHTRHFLGQRDRLLDGVEVDRLAVLTAAGLGEGDR
jgi:quinol monooxygenase YgiN